MAREPGPASATPVAERIVALDFLRGMALFGVCAVNLLSFALDSDRAWSVDATEPYRDQFAWAAVTGLLASKSFPLFSLLFGMGFQLQMERAQRTGCAFAPTYRRRLLVLGLFGILHGVLLFPGDILLVYALAGGVLLWTRRAATPSLWGAALTVLVLGELASLVTFMTIGLGMDPEWVALERTGYADGPWSATLHANVVGYTGWLGLSTMMSFNWRVMACFFAGAALMRGGFLQPERALVHRRLWRIGLLFGLPLVAGALAAQRFAERELLGAALDEVGSLPLTAAWLGGCLLLARSGAVPWLVTAVAATGRMALTNYLGQSILACVLFRWYGFDLFDRLGRLSLLGIALAIWSAQTVFSVCWLRWFAMGPFEWCWRRATYGAVRSAGPGGGAREHSNL